jgi:hypothetical protein
MRRYEHDALRQVALREGHAGGGGGGKPRCNPVHDLAGDAGAVERFGFLAPAAENERIAAFQTDDCVTGFRFGNHQALDESLRRRVAAAPLSHFHHARAFAHMHENRAVHEIVDENDVGHAEHAHRFERKQLRIARTRTHQPHFSGPRHSRQVRARRACSIRPGARSAPERAPHRQARLRSTRR